MCAKIFPKWIGAAALLTTSAAGIAAPQRNSPKTFRDCASCPEMVRVPGGSFLMGSPTTDSDSDDMERPQVQVTIRAFAIGRYPVTRREYAAFVRETRRPSSKGCSWTARAKVAPDGVSSWRDTGFPQSGRSPAVCVTWDDVNAYVTWLRSKTRKVYRLPSESEWEYAARAGSTTRFPWGDMASHDRANFGAENWGTLASGRDRWAYTSPVGSFPPNRFGLHDMNGNVLEFVADCFSPDYRRLPKDGSAFLVSETMTSNPVKELNGRDSCSLHMLRGGDWGDPGFQIRSAARNFGPPPPSQRSGGVGFRVALLVGGLATRRLNGDYGKLPRSRGG